MARGGRKGASRDFVSAPPAALGIRVAWSSPFTRHIQIQPISLLTGAGGRGDAAMGLILLILLIVLLIGGLPNWPGSPRWGTPPAVPWGRCC